MARVLDRQIVVQQYSNEKNIYINENKKRLLLGSHTEFRTFFIDPIFPIFGESFVK